MNHTDFLMLDALEAYKKEGEGMNGISPSPATQTVKRKIKALKTGVNFVCLHPDGMVFDVEEVRWGGTVVVNTRIYIPYGKEYK